MRKLLLFALAAFGFVACSQFESEMRPEADAQREVITLSLGEDDTRVQLAAGKSVWTKDDRISVFRNNNSNQMWGYTGETGARYGTFVEESAGEAATEEFEHIVVAYPYSSDYYITPNEGGYTLEALLPEHQTYIKDSFGTDGVLMVGQSLDMEFALKNVCGWLKLDITGNGEVIDKITVRGNRGEQVAGLIYVSSEDGSSMTAEAFNSAEQSGLESNILSGALVAEDDIKRKVALYCTEGVKLSAEPVSFYIALPPQEFADGLTIDIHSTEACLVMEKSTAGFTVERNHIHPMRSFEFSNAVSEIEYTTSTSTILEPAASAFNVSVVSNTYQEECGPGGVCAIYGTMRFNGVLTTINDSAFEGSTISSFTLPASVTSIGANAFKGSSLRNLYCKPVTPPAGGAGMLDGLHARARIYVPTRVLNAYKSAEYWSAYATKIVSDGSPEGPALPTDPDTENYAFNHRILLVDHTGVGCTNCPRIIDGLIALGETEISKHYNEVACHGDITFAKEHNDNAYSEAAAIVDLFYAISTYPNIQFNFASGDGNVNNVANNSTTIASLVKEEGADVGIAIATTLEDDTVCVNVGVKAAVEQEYRVTVWLLENNISNPNQLGATSDLHFTHNHALRNIAGAHSSDDISGDSIGVVAVGATKQHYVELTVEEGWNSANMDVLVIVSADDGTGFFEVANTALCPVGQSREIEYIN